MKNQGETITQTTNKDPKPKPRFTSPPPKICTKKLTDSQDIEYCGKIFSVPSSLNPSPTKLEVKQKVSSFIEKKVIKSRPGHNPRTQIVNKEDNKREKLKKLNRSRAHLQYLKKNLTKRNCSVSILDFWSSEMLVSATKLVNRPKAIEKNSEFHLPVIKPLKQRQITPVPKVSTITPSGKGYNDYVLTITKACDEAYNETKKLKTKLSSSMSHLISQ